MMESVFARFAMMHASPPSTPNKGRSAPKCPGAPRKRAPSNPLKRTYADAFGYFTLQPAPASHIIYIDESDDGESSDSYAETDSWEDIDLS